MTMNSLIEQQYGILEMTLGLRHEVLTLVNDADLAYALPGNMTLGALCRQQGEIDRSYIEAFRTFKQEWTCRHEDDRVEQQVEALRGWYVDLEAEFKAVVGDLTEAQVQTQMIDRGTGMDFPVGITFHIYRESLLIFLAKASLYLRALDKPVSARMTMWIG
jgi:hypothetical protein